MGKYRSISLLFFISLCSGAGALLSQGLGPPSRSDNETALSRQGAGRSAVPGGAVAVASVLPRGVRQIQQGQYEVTDPRPLEVVAHLLSLKLGVSIAYEEAAWVSDRDVIRAADYPANQSLISRNATSRGPLIPRGGTVDVTIPTSQNLNQTDNASNVIQAALNNHRGHKNPGDFKLVRFGDGEFSIVAERAENEAGVLVNQHSPLDAKISFPEAERTWRETIDIIYQSIRNASHAPITDLGHPMQDSDTTRLRLGARDDIARDVLAKALRRPGRSKFSWILRYDPQNKIYTIVLIGVQAEVPIQGGGTGILPLAWPK